MRWSVGVECQIPPEVLYIIRLLFIDEAETKQDTKLCLNVVDKKNGALSER